MRNTLRLFISCYIDIMQTSAPTVHILWNYIFILAAKLATKKTVTAIIKYNGNDCLCLLQLYYCFYFII